MPALYPAPNTKAELRHMRQRELERQMEDIQQEMKALRTEAAERRTSVKSSDGRRTRLLSRTDSAFEEEEDISQLKEQIRVMNQQMTLLRDQLQSPWAQGLSDDPPPGYTPR
jgi:chromosome segregation ATPase